MNGLTGGVGWWQGQLPAGCFARAFWTNMPRWPDNMRNWAPSQGGDHQRNAVGWLDGPCLGWVDGQRWPLMSCVFWSWSRREETATFKLKFVPYFFEHVLLDVALIPS